MRCRGGASVNEADCWHGRRSGWPSTSGPSASCSSTRCHGPRPTRSARPTLSRSSRDSCSRRHGASYSRARPVSFEQTCRDALRAGPAERGTASHARSVPSSDGLAGSEPLGSRSRWAQGRWNKCMAAPQDLLRGTGPTRGRHGLSEATRRNRTLQTYESYGRESSMPPKTGARTQAAPQGKRRKARTAKKSSKTAHRTTTKKSAATRQTEASRRRPLNC